MRPITPIVAALLAVLSAAAPHPALAQQAVAAQGPGSAAADLAAQALRAEVDRLRQEFEAVKRQYGDRLTALEARLATLDARQPGVAAQSAAAPPAVNPLPEPAAPPVGTTEPQASLLSKVFNPDMAVIGDFLGAAGTNRTAPSPALEMHETEVSFRAAVDPYARADFYLSVGADGGIDLEEGYLTFNELPGGLLTKVGKLHAAFGKVNQMHTHALPWTDRPLVTSNLTGGEEGISDAGLSVSRLIPNRWMFLEATGEVYRGESAVFHAPSRGDLSYVGRMRGYQDVGESSNIDLGASVAFGHNDSGPDSTTRLVGIDATFRFRPLRRAIDHRFLARTELVWSRRSELAGRPQSFGMYASGEYQFSRRWYGGVRFDRSDRATNPYMTDKGGSLILTYWPSEFSQVRGQFRRTRYAEGATANEFLFQFLFSIGAHGAHTF